MSVKEFEIDASDVPQELRDILDRLPNGGYIAGGAVSAMFSGSDYGDIDVWFDSPISYDDALTDIQERGNRPIYRQSDTDFLKKQAMDGTITWKEFRARAKMSDNQTEDRTLHFEMLRFEGVGHELELHGHDYLEPHEQVDRFDHLGVAMAIERVGRKYYLVEKEGAIQAAAGKRLIFTRPDSGDRTGRTFKYLRKGWILE